MGCERSLKVFGAAFYKKRQFSHTPTRAPRWKRKIVQKRGSIFEQDFPGERQRVIRENPVARPHKEKFSRFRGSEIRMNFCGRRCRSALEPGCVYPKSGRRLRRTKRSFGPPRGVAATRALLRSAIRAKLSCDSFEITGPCAQWRSRLGGQCRIRENSSFSVRRQRRRK